MDSEDFDIPGVTFYVLSSNKAGSTTHKAIGTVSLRATIDNLEIWDEVIRRLNGYRVFSVDDFNSQIAIALRSENVGLVAKLDKTERELAHQRQITEQTLSVLGKENHELKERAEHLRQILRTLGLELDR